MKNNIKLLLAVLCLGFYPTQLVSGEMVEPEETVEPTETDVPEEGGPEGEVPEGYVESGGAEGGGGTVESDPTTVENDATQKINNADTAGTGETGQFLLEDAPSTEAPTDLVEYEPASTPEEATANAEEAGENVNSETSQAEFNESAENMAQDAQSSGKSFWDLLNDFLSKAANSYIDAMNKVADFLIDIGTSIIDALDSLFTNMAEALIDLFTRTEYTESTEVPEAEESSSSSSAEDAAPEANTYDAPTTDAEAREVLNSLIDSEYQLDENSSRSQIKKAYREAAKECHPDKVSSTGDAELISNATAQFQQVSQAFRMLL